MAKPLSAGMEGSTGVASETILPFRGARGALGLNNTFVPATGLGERQIKKCASMQPSL